MTPFLDVVSQVIGWSYFVAWSVSFYPQFFLNLRRKSVVGLSLDFVYLNFVGFSFYTIYNMAFYFSPSIRDEYARRHGGNQNLVQLNDVFFGAHATIISGLTLLQTFIYERDINRTPRLAFTLLPFIMLATGVLVILALLGHIQWIDALYFMGGVKIFISLCKYIPQAILNYQRQSTSGWSIGNILLDFTGGVLSVAQQFLDAFNKDDFSGITGNYAKFMLGFVSIIFDLIFMTQHFILYKDKDKDVEEGEEVPIGN